MQKVLLLFCWFIPFFAYSQFYEASVYAVTSLQPAQPGSEVRNTIDGDVNTVYHSRWSQVGIPDVLHFYFTSEVKSISKVIYTPRRNGINGIWTNLIVSYSTHMNPEEFITIANDVIWEANNEEKELVFASAIQNPFSIKFEINGGGGNYSSCAEMKFFSEEMVDPPFDGIDCNISTAPLTINGATDLRVSILAEGTVASSFQPGENINRSFDGNLNTLYHSSYNSTSFPVELNYRFNGTTPIDYLRYFPRSDGGANGNFGNVAISYNTIDNSTYQPLMIFNFEQNGIPTRLTFPNRIMPLNIRFSVMDGFNDFVSCAEMEFYTSSTTTSLTPYDNIFSNSIYSELFPFVSQENIDTISSLFYRNLAQCLFNDTYIHEYRVQSYEVYPTIQSLRQSLKIGNYDIFENSTGIVFDQNEKIALFVQNIPVDIPVYLAVKDFQSGFDGAVSYFDMNNGLNVFQLTHGGMAYISYFNNDSTLNDVSINIVSGKVNGYFDKEKSSEVDWPGLLLNSSYPYIDIRGEFVHLVYQKESLRNGSPFNGLELLEKYDEVVKHQRALKGLFRFNKSPKNRQLTYNEYGNGYYAGGLGVHLDLSWGEEALTNPERLDLWGIAHEYGHINQIRPDLMWIGTAEVTVNIYTVWVDYNMNHENNPYTRLEKELSRPAADLPLIEGGRINGAIYNTLIKSEPLQGSSDYDVFKVLVPFWQLQVYYQLAGASRDAPPLTFDYPSDYTGIDYAYWFGLVAETSRNTNSNGLSNGELLLNFVKNTCEAVQEDLTLFFQNTGFLKPIDIEIDDYGIGLLRITQQQIDETISYIQAKAYPQPVSPVIHYASAHSVKAYKEKLQLSGRSGEGVELDGQYLIVQHSEWLNAVAFETYDSTNQLIYVSIAGSGDVNNETTKVYYPDDALEVYAVGFDGQRILVYPSILVSTTELAKQQLIQVFPNPVSKGSSIVLELEQTSKFYKARVISLNGKEVLISSGEVNKIQNDINHRLGTLHSGVYFLVLSDDMGIQTVAKFIVE